MKKGEVKPPPCQHPNAYPIVTLGGHVPVRATDGRPIGYCNDCNGVGADILIKKELNRGQC